MADINSKYSMPGNKVMIRNFITYQILEANQTKAALFGAAKFGGSRLHVQKLYHRFVMQFYNIYDNVATVLMKEASKEEQPAIEKITNFFNQPNLCCYSELSGGLDGGMLRKSINEAFSTYDLFTRLIVRHNIFDPSFTTQSGRKSIFEESMGL